MRVPSAQPLPEVRKVVEAYNEWDPLEEVIVGVVEGSAVPPPHIAVRATAPSDQLAFFDRMGGKPFPPEEIKAAAKELDELVRILEAEGVKVRRPDRMNHARPFATQDWQEKSGVYAAMPRDLLLVIGDELIETPMAWRSRYFEVNAYRTLLKEYFQAGAKWTAAPKPELKDELYDYDFKDPVDGEMRYVIKETEPTFDAADFVRCGRDIFGQKSNVTNAFGIEWLRRHLGDRYRVHELQTVDSHPMHIDATFMPLAPGRVLLNPERLPQLPPMFKKWEPLYAPNPMAAQPGDPPLYMTSRWISMNILMLDTERVICEAREEDLITQFKRWGFKPIRVPFRHFNPFGGSFHCATLDVRRRGTLQSYF